MYEQKPETQETLTTDLGISTHLEGNQALLSLSAFRKDCFPCSITGHDMVFKTTKVREQRASSLTLAGGQRPAPRSTGWEVTGAPVQITMCSCNRQPTDRQQDSLLSSACLLPLTWTSRQSVKTLPSKA